ncbi:membrane protein [Pullulanibacillus camelliae]|uniref:Membrane protein n=1 Tax=Pullulanibacillus camelliae TaxID=1707096 RepID=A0A8J2YEQ5_9BACL|nr:YndM family protein [Pullulanibacillus camelliae]GGE26287.1 membrane protein [Pullulanibacillus camelliae]
MIKLKHFAPLLIKFIMVFAVLYVVAGLFYEWSFSSVLWTSIVLTVVAYLIGDLWILSTAGNVMATLIDFILGLSILWILGNVFLDRAVSMVREPMISALIIAAGEWLFHKYLVERLDRHEMKSRPMLGK